MSSIGAAPTGSGRHATFPESPCGAPAAPSLAIMTNSSAENTSRKGEYREQEPREAKELLPRLTFDLLPNLFCILPSKSCHGAHREMS